MIKDKTSKRLRILTEKSDTSTRGMIVRLALTAVALTLIAGVPNISEAAGKSRAGTLVQTTTFPSGDDGKTVIGSHTGGKDNVLVQTPTFPSGSDGKTFIRSHNGSIGK